MQTAIGHVSTSLSIAKPSKSIWQAREVGTRVGLCMGRARWENSPHKTRLKKGLVGIDRTHVRTIMQKTVLDFAMPRLILLTPPVEGKIVT